MRDTICALATPPGQSALAMLRVSGPRAFEIHTQIFQPKTGIQKHFVATRGDILDLDDAICITFPEGKSFTGEPSFELTLHGSPIIIEQVLEVLRQSGARTARPGEFSLRAFLSGKIDLCEAEAIADLIHARSEKAAQVALRNLKGALLQYLEPTRINIIDILCEIEARLDFPDENLGPAHREALVAQLQVSIQTLSQLLASAKMGKRLMEGARVVLIGLPNAGKSTLFNALLGEEKALVHELPGTTRDVIEANWILNGIPVTLVDVAGIRESEDPIECLGIEKARRELDRADLILWLEEAACEINMLPQNMDVPVIKLRTKIDLPSPACGRGQGEGAISAKTGQGLAELKTQMTSVLMGDVLETSEAILTKARQKEEVQKAKECLQEAESAILCNEPDEIIAFELRTAGQALDRLLGKNLNEEVLDLIFSRFCIGK